jgi:hypothetical protein
LTDVLVGTERGLHTPGVGTDLEGHDVWALAADRWGVWALVGGGSVWRRTAGPWVEVTEVPDLKGQCLSASEQGLLVGTAEARLLRLEEGTLERVVEFDRVEGRDGWSTPWGGPPATRSIARGADGTIYANVHVGGIVRSADGRAWEPTIEVDADVHQVIAHPDRAGLVLAASARGLERSEDRGRTWSTHADGLHGRYSRAVAMAGDTLVMTSSTGPFTERAALYRRPLDGERGFERSSDGLPEWFPSNIDSHCLAASGSTVVFGTDRGEVYRSEDAGQTWERIAGGLPAVRCVLAV